MHSVRVLAAHGCKWTASPGGTGVVDCVTFKLVCKNMQYAYGFVVILVIKLF